MTFLWINGIRMDSIPLLRRHFSCLDSEEKERDCKELIQKYHSGVLSGWLKRQSEADITLLYTKPAELKEETEQLNALTKEPRPEAEAVLPNLARLCGVESSYMADIFGRILEEQPEILRSQKVPEAVCEQTWFKEMERSGQSDLNWAKAATDTDSLEQLVTEELERLEKQEKQKEGTPVTLYLCNVGNRFTINNPFRYHDLYLLGLGAPEVSFGSQNRKKTLDMDEHNLTFQDFTLHRQGVNLNTKNANKRLNGVQVK